MNPTPRGRGRGQPSSDRGISTNRGRGRGSDRGAPRGRYPNPPRGRGNRPPRPRDPDYPSVPAITSLYEGRAVSIILKQDQQTGHQVHGIVADLLTRGDHPRGVKVRLRDGRVGRVQKLITPAEGEQGERLVGGASANLGRNGDGVESSTRGRGGLGMRGGRIERDIREEDDYLYDESRGNAPVRNDGLFAALEAADQRHQEERGLGGEEKIATCPVCGEFEGDERAVAHHVESHFGS
ncbi:hypothetical protein HBH64_197820 [Parastagonospora nodorum]|nr:hypothetical protein HBH53_232820 [Parastagonospora nodorum]KAH4289684.1 hypothetical protein HBI02_204420 [Parastagonospora nodorum]KAH4289957.1 hypothetical protein HBI01_204990 [Parastagonospora nodorum]KAH4322350.1 hypothetical protein HBI00_199380 [Parastagonospora nodorum]KAH4358347.1 hypothetical protein HBH94_211540 [Parastagonospora nodorum]